MIRAATQADVPHMVALSEQARSRLADYLPTFWRKAADSAAVQAQFFNSLVEKGETIMHVHETDGGIDGFLIAMLMAAPPVYDPGGMTCLIDDLCVADDADWPIVGRDLLHTATAAARAQGAVQVVVICPERYTAKYKFLAAEGLIVGSTWHVGDL